METRRSSAWLIRAGKLLLGVLLAAGLAAVGWYARQAVNSGGFFRLAEIRYEGVRHFDTAAFDRLFGLSFGGGLLELDLHRVRGLIESERWVKSAVVRRRLPGTLQIYLTEREPIAVAAIEDELFVVDREGVLLDKYGPRFQHIDRPIVKGLVSGAVENSAEENARRIGVYLEVLAELSGPEFDHAAEVSEIDVQNPQRVGVYPVDDPVPVFLGDGHYRQRYEIFLSQRELYLEVKAKYGYIEYVDVTYENRIIFHTPTEPVPGHTSEQWQKRSG